MKLPDNSLTVHALLHGTQHVKCYLAITFVILDTLNIFLIDWLIDYSYHACTVYYWTVFAQNRDTAVPAEGNGDLQTLICVLVARPRRFSTLSNPVIWQNWMAAYLGYTLRMKTPFCGWPVMVHDTHTRRRSVLVLNTCMDTNMQLTINSFRQLFPDKISTLTIPWHFPDFQ